MLVVHSSGVLYGFPLTSVEEIKKLDEVSSIPGASSVVRGGIWHRNDQLPLIDLRKVFSLPSLQEERTQLVQTLDQREKDHIEWIDELQASVREKREFRKTTDPKKCAFGKWYYSFKTYDSHIERLFQAFEKPHADIHGLAVQVIDLARQDKMEEAIARVEAARSAELSKLLQLFTEFKGALVHDLREIGIVIKVGSKKAAIVVDAVENIHRMSAQTHHAEVPEGSSKYISQTIKSKNDTIYYLNVDELVHLSCIDVEHKRDAVS